MKTIIAITIVVMLIVVPLFGTVKANPSSMPSSPIITIAKDGSIQPQNLGIVTHKGVTYYLNDNSENFCIKIYCSNIVFDGQGYCLDGSKFKNPYGGFSPFGISINYAENVIIKNIALEGFNIGISLKESNNCRIENVSTNNAALQINGCFSTVTKCLITNYNFGINFPTGSNHNIISDNNIVNNLQSICIIDSKENIFSGNNFFNSSKGIVFESNCYPNQSFSETYSPCNNTFFSNNFVNNSEPIYYTRFILKEGVSTTFGSGFLNYWDNGSSGNYWSDYYTKYPNASQIGNTGKENTPYYLAPNNIDNYPLVNPVYIQAPNTPLILHTLPASYSPVPSPTSNSSISPSPTVPEFPIIVIVTLMIVILAFTLALRRKKH
jgi:parallel beta-helix repeat protein